MPGYNYKQLTKKLKKLGFRFYRQGKGSHVMWTRESDNTIIPIPDHGKKNIRIGTIHQICKDAGLKNIHDLGKI